MYDKTALAIWCRDTRSIQDVLSKTIFKKSEIVTPDETYFVFVWDCMSENMFGRLQKAIQDIRHSLIAVQEDHQILKDVLSEDSRGCDGVFDKILSWDASIQIWNSDMENFSENNTDAIKIPLPNGKILVARKKKNDVFSDELTIAIEDEKGNFLQNIASIGLDFLYQSGHWKTLNDLYKINIFEDTCVCYPSSVHKIHSV